MASIYLDERSVSREEVLARAARGARLLHEAGVREGDAVALLLRNDFAFFEAMQATAALGAYAVPINWHGKPDEVLYVIGDAQPKVLIAHADLLATVRQELPADLAVFVVPTPPELLERFGLPLAAGRPAPGERAWQAAADACAPWDGPAVKLRSSMIYTSGTTGRPKGVQREPATAEQVAANAALLRQVWGVEPGMRALIAGPMYHASPNSYARQVLPAAERIVLQSRFDAEDTLATIARHGITHAVMVPTMFVRILKLPEAVRRKYDVSSLRWVVHTGAPCPREVKQALMDWWGPVVYETYGGTEVGTATLSTPQDWLAHPGSVGRPVPGARIAIYGDDGVPVADGVPGEIFVKVDAHPDFTYLHDDDKRRAAERDGLISVGDVGYLQDGLLYICDRRSDMVISAGVNIYPAEVEAALAQCPGVQDCAVFGIPDDEFGEVLAAAIELLPHSDATEAELRGYLAEKLAKYKIPRKFDFYERLPREESGKIFKRKLRAPYWEAAGRRI
ncbi:AMP-binding protein [Verticiella sediminum]|uniref:AMP-binding protein n=1 Tax=Verticiella sediminum TaxID=1247510 RepID=A0A556AJF7_9BURK|nr:acyl-CoA synthetase [Verticiella sediminum]TSH93044.1 AMP-binding protein [Verticiella sediminum]